MARLKRTAFFLSVSALAFWAASGHATFAQSAGPGSAVDSSVRAGAFQEAASLLEKQAKAGNAGAQYELGSLYRIGKGVAQDDAAAFYWMREAAQNGHVRAQYSLATMYLTGRGTAVDVKEAESWAKRAMEKGHPQAQALLNKIATGQTAPAKAAAAGSWQTAAVSPGTSAAISHEMAMGAKGPQLLIEASRRSNVEAVRMLSQNRAALEARDEDGNTALALAAANGNVAIIDALIAAGANIETRNNAQETPLMLAAAAGKEQAAERLAAKGASLAAVRTDNATALTLALRRCHEKTVAVLLAKGANPDMDGAREGTPLAIASRSCSGRVVQALLDRGAQVDKPAPMDAHRFGSLPTARTLKRWSC